MKRDNVKYNIILGLFFAVGLGVLALIAKDANDRASPPDPRVKYLD